MSNSFGGLTGLQALTSVGGSMTIQTNNSMTNVNGLKALKTVGGFVSIYNNAGSGTGLQTLDLAALTTVGGYLSIQYNYALTNLSNLTNLTSVGTTNNDYLTIYDNYQNGTAGLSSILGIIKGTGGTGKLATLHGALTVAQNGLLPQCQGDYLNTLLKPTSYSGGGNIACAKSCVTGVCQ